MVFLDFTSVLLALVVALVFGWVILGSLSKVATKRIEFIMVSAAALGVIGSTFRAREYASAMQAEAWDELAKQNGARMVGYLNDARSTACGNPAAVPECTWFETNSGEITTGAEKLQPVFVSAFSGPSSDQNARGTVGGMTAYVAWFNDTLSKRERARDRFETGGRLSDLNRRLERLSVLFGPYLIAVAAGFKLAQILVQ